MTPPRVLIVGGGVAALEAMIALRAIAKDRVEVQLYAPRADFVYRPYAVAEPFGGGEVLRFDLAELAARCDAEFVARSATGVRADERLVILRGDREVRYDFLVLACGTKSIGAVTGALPFWGASGDTGIEDVVGELKSGQVRSVVFTTPGGPAWPLPVYELPLLTRSHLEAAGVEDARLTIVTPEEAPLQLFGLGASEAVNSLLARRRIRIVTGTRPRRFEAGVLDVLPKGSIPADRVVAMPSLEGRRLSGVPHDASGFVRVDPHGRVPRLERVFAAGDLIDFPIKHGGLAAQQADAVAEQIAADVGVDLHPEPFEPVLRGKLLTGEDPKFISGDLTGGKGETSLLSDGALWWPPGKIAGRYLAPFLADRSDAELQPPDPEALTPVEIDLGATREALAAMDPTAVVEGH